MFNTGVQLMAKISVVGAGNVGATTVQRLAELELGEIVMTDIVEGLPQGKALDLMQAGAIKGYDTSIIGTNDYADIADSDLVIITAGIARKPGMTREDLIRTNSKIITEVSKNIAKYAPESIVINVTNPLDIITYVAMKSTGFETKKVFGMSGVLDSGRFASFIAEELKCSKKEEQKVIKQNEKLKNIAWNQSHIVRRHVANILGLCNHINDQENLAGEDLAKYISYLFQSAQELDRIVHEIVSHTEEEIYNI